MDQSSGPSGKRAWHSPEIIDVGAVVETTTTGNQNVLDNQGTNLPPTYHDPPPPPKAEVDLGDR
jgi:hypothetical protein